MFKRFCIAALAMMSALHAYAQNFSLHGKVVNDFTDEALPHAVIYIQQLNLSTTSDELGNFKLSNVPPGEHLLEVKFVGHDALQKHVNITNRDLHLVLRLTGHTMRKQVIVQGTRANSSTPIAYAEVGKEEIQRLNNGQDIPYILRFTPSLVATSDAGTGIGYTGLWIRGSDPSRINVTVNDIPINDPESQQVFWVNMPDFGSSADGIQVQRGVGTSTNGAASLGGTIKLGTTNIKPNAYAELSNTYGSFNTLKNTVMAGTGLIDERYTFDMRLSNISSDGFIDRASSRMKSFYASGARYGESSVLKLTVFGGNERTYQSWDGVPVSRLLGNRDSMMTYASYEWLSDEELEHLLNSNSRTYNKHTYKNEVDDYTQTHYQLHYSKHFTDKLTLNLAGHYTRGRGYFEQFKKQAKYANYGLENVIVGTDTLTRTDLVRRRWLSNHFYGTVGSLMFKNQNLNAVLGWAYNQYDGEHYGDFAWMQYAGNNFIDDRYYQGNSLKKDGNIYARALYSIADKWDVYGDVQVRNVNYTTSGIDNDLRSYDVKDNLAFFNPKVGLTWRRNTQEKWYASFAVGNKEPNRNDYIDAMAGVVPVHETLYDTEVGYQRWGKNYCISVNFYNMQYNNQLVLTGDLNDVGAAIRMNVKDSYRRGIELEGGLRFNEALEWNANVTLSSNKIKAFDHILYDYTDYENTVVVRKNYTNTDIAFSPSVLAGSQIQWHVWQNRENENTSGKHRLTLALLSKYVGKQYLDNTSNDDLTIDAYFINDVQLIYSLPYRKQCLMSLVVTCNNVLDTKYSSNGYTYGYIIDGRTIHQPFYFPQAGRNLLVSLIMRF